MLLIDRVIHAAWNRSQQAVRNPYDRDGARNLWRGGYHTGWSLLTADNADNSSKSQEQWDATEAQAKQFESLLRAYKLWDDKILFVNDEHETTGEPVKGWGETVASTLAGGASFLAGKIAGFTDK